MTFRATLTAISCFLAVACCAAEPNQSAALSVVEYEVQLPMKNADESLSSCATFDNAEKRIESFFALAEKIADEPKLKPSKVCVITGVATDQTGNTVDLQILGGTFGTLSHQGKTQWFICKKGSRCCEKLPSFCKAAL
jgi:hypothetical protein